MKIGMVSEFYYPQPGGVGEHIRALSVELAKRGHEIVVLTSEIQGSVPVGGPRVRRIGRSLPLRYNGSVSRISIGLGLGNRLRGVLDEEQCDLLHVHNPLMPTLPLLALRHARCPIVATFHSCYRRDLLAGCLRAPLRRLLDRIDARIAVSPSARRTVASLFPGDYAIVPNGVDFDWFSRASALRKRNGNGGSPQGSRRKHRLLFIGALVWRKGLPDLIRAFTRLREYRDDVELIVVGDGPQRSRVHRMVPHTLRDDVQFLGCVSRETLLDCVASTDVFCAPSLGRESFGIVLLEAMAGGLPVIASDIDGYRDVLAGGADGLLIPPGDTESWASAIRFLLEDPERRNHASRRGQHRAWQLRWSEVARNLECIYDSVLGLKNSSETGTELSLVPGETVSVVGED